MPAATENGVRCRLCGGDTRPYGDRGDVALHRCLHCRFVSGRPARPFTAAGHYEHLYASPAPAAPEGRYTQWLARAERSVGVGRLLEVGAGRGAFVRIALARGWRVDATEVSRSGLEALDGTGARVFAGELQDAAYPGATFDLAVMVEVLEHLADPMAVLRETVRVVRPGGLVLLTTPNFGGLSRRRLGLRWRVIDPEHLGYFNARTLARALRAAGCRIVRVRSRSLDISTWKKPAPGKPAAIFDPQATARLRDEIESSFTLRSAKEALNLALAATGLGDSLVAWAER